MQLHRVDKKKYRYVYILLVQCAKIIRGKKKQNLWKPHCSLQRLKSTFFEKICTKRPPSSYVLGSCLVKKNSQNVYFSHALVGSLFNILFFRCFFSPLWFTLAESSSNFIPPTPSNFSKLMYPFHRKHTPFRISGESM